MSDIKVTIGGDAKAFEKTVEAVKSKAAGMGSAIGKIGALAGVGGIAGITTAAAAAVNAIGGISDAASNVGMSVEDYQILGYAFRDIGLSSADAEKAISTMNAKIGEAAGGSETANASLNKIGLTVEGLENMSPAEQFEMIAKAISQLPSEAERAAAAVDFFGKSGKKMDQLLTAYDSVIDKVKESNAVISTAASEAADKMGDDLAKLKDALLAAFSESGALANLSSFIDYLGKAAEGINALRASSEKLAQINAAGADAYTGGFWSNLKDAYLGESEGAKIVARAPNEKEKRDFKDKQEAEKKRAADEAKMKQDAADKLAEKERKAQERKEKDQKKTAKEVDKLIAEGDKAEKERDKDREQMRKDAEKGLADQIFSEQMDAMREAGKSVDRVDADRKVDMPTLRAIGANLPGNISAEGINSLDKQRNDLINKILDTISRGDFGKPDVKVVE